MKDVTRSSRADVRFLARVVSDFGLVPRDPRYLGPRIQKWLQEARKEAWSAAAYFRCVRRYHNKHRTLGIPGGSACDSFRKELAQSSCMENTVEDLRKQGVLLPMNVSKQEDNVQKENGDRDHERTAAQRDS